MEAATRVFTKRGLQQASVDEVAEDAGYTKGAFYANFKSKEELFLAMLDERFAERVEELDRVISGSGELEEQARAAGSDFTRYVAADPEWQRLYFADYLSDEEWSRLFFEFAAYAARNEDFRQELVTRYRTLRERVAELFERRAKEAGLESPISAQEVAMMTFAMANGFALERLLEPDAVPDDLYGTMLATFFTGMRAGAVPQAGEGVSPK
jgi:AcrR family transcriptional regulator